MSNVLTQTTSILQQVQGNDGSTTDMIIMCVIITIALVMFVGAFSLRAE